MSADEQVVLHAPMCCRCWLLCLQGDRTAPLGMVAHVADEDDIREPCEWCGKVTPWRARIEVIDLGRGEL